VYFLPHRLLVEVAGLRTTYIFEQKQRSVAERPAFLGIVFTLIDKPAIRSPAKAPACVLRQVARFYWTEQ
jgi:hypothetical protein